MNHRLRLSTVNYGIKNKTVGMLFFSRDRLPSAQNLNAHGLKNIRIFFFILHSDGNQRKKAMLAFFPPFKVIICRILATEILLYLICHLVLGYFKDH